MMAGSRLGKLIGLFTHFHGSAKKSVPSILLVEGILREGLKTANQAIKSKLGPVPAHINMISKCDL